MAKKVFLVEVDMKQNKIIDLKDPTSNQDAATKKYVDDENDEYLPLAGGHMDEGSAIDFLDSYVAKIDAYGFEWNNPGYKTLIRGTGILTGAGGADAIRWTNGGQVGIGGSAASGMALTVNGKMKVTKGLSIGERSTVDNDAGGIWIEGLDNDDFEDDLGYRIRHYGITPTKSYKGENGTDDGSTPYHSLGYGSYGGHDFYALGAMRARISDYGLKVYGKVHTTGNITTNGIGFNDNGTGTVVGWIHKDGNDIVLDNDVGGFFKWRDGNSSNVTKMSLDIDIGRLWAYSLGIGTGGSAASNASMVFEGGNEINSYTSSKAIYLNYANGTKVYVGQSSHSSDFRVFGKAQCNSIKTGTTAQHIEIKFWKGTQAQYNAIGTKDANTQYNIVG